MPKDVQIGADVEPWLRDGIRTYASGMHLSESAVITLLVARELRVKRLGSLPLSNSAKRTTPRCRLTARQDAPSLREELEAHVKALGVRRSMAVAMLAEAELHEQWLSKALGLNEESS